MNRNFKVHLHVAAFAREVFGMVLRVEELWIAGEIDGAPKTPLRQTHLSNLLGLSDEQRTEALSALTEDGYKVYRQLLL